MKNTSRALAALCRPATPLIHIDHGIPVPPKRNPRGVGPQYPLETMSVGDSFFIPVVGKAQAEKVRNRISSAACNRKNSWTKQGRKFTTRMIDGGVRCWRIA